MRSTSHFERCPPEADAAVRAFLEGRFGLPASVLAHHTFWHRPGTPTLWLTTASASAPRGVRVEAMGLPALRDPLPGGKPTGAFLRRFGHDCRWNICLLSEDDGDRHLSGQSVAAPPIDDGRGWCLVRTPTRILGRGFYDDGLVHSQIKKVFSSELTS